ncbi:hypothetical protein TREES_T100000616 [Tupaia chinensis]|uniref:Uncharacterized protein n=1 Tax=Tupaia chinensis TaxID=246437 RepID=L9KPA6_TUPCH|nr:hypothetical protein TREES_T100000616 [Tupaia chinensis]
MSVPESSQNEKHTLVLPCSRMCLGLVFNTVERTRRLVLGEELLKMPLPDGVTKDTAERLLHDFPLLMERSTMSFGESPVDRRYHIKAIAAKVIPTCKLIALPAVSY